MYGYIEDGMYTLYLLRMSSAPLLICRGIQPHHLAPPSAHLPSEESKPLRKAFKGLPIPRGLYCEEHDGPFYLVFVPALYMPHQGVDGSVSLNCSP